MSPSPKPPQAGFATLNRARLVQYFFFGVFLLLLYQLILILQPFYIAILGSSILALMLYPLHHRVLKAMDEFPSAAAGLSTAIVVVVVVVPVLLIGWLFLKETMKVYPTANGWLTEMRGLKAGEIEAKLPEQARPLYESSKDFLEFWNIDLQDILLKNLDQLSSTMTHLAGNIIKDTAYVGFNVVMLAFTLFFFLRDGPMMIRRLTELIPMSPDHKQAIISQLQNTLYAVIRGMLTLALIQGFATGLGFALFGVPFPVLLGALTTLLSPIPLGSLFAVIGPVLIGLLISGAVHKAVYVGVWCLLIIGLIDHILRPLLIGAQAKLPTLLLFFGLLGGLKVYGFLGILIGPLLITLVLAFINIYREEYHWLLSPEP